MLRLTYFFVEASQNPTSSYSEYAAAAGIPFFYWKPPVRNSIPSGKKLQPQQTGI